MGCSGCSTGRGTNNLPAGCNSNGGCSTGGCNKLNVFDWLTNMELPAGQTAYDIVEVRFKNGRKGYYQNVNNLQLCVGDVVAVEASPGHDIGTISLTGELVRLQVDKKSVKKDDIKKLYRKAKPNDIDKWQETLTLEKPTMTQARKHAIELGLNMKICDVEYQGDKTKVTFYYTADERVDFRELIKLYASDFKVRIEMRQIGARQEAAKLGGVGACGRELCCSSWLTDFRTVSTTAARYQQLSLNPQKLAGQCGKLKCCLNFELDSYLDALNDFPDTNIPLKSSKGTLVHFKSDIFRKVIWYLNRDERSGFIPLSIEKVKAIQALNKKGETPEVISDIDVVEVENKEPDYLNVVGQDDLTRFDSQKSKNNNNKKKFKKKPQGNNQNGPKQDKDSNNSNQNANAQVRNTPRPRPQKNESNGPNKPVESVGENQAAKGPNPRPNKRRNFKKRPNNNNPKKEGES